MAWYLSLLTIFGLSFSFWLLMGLIRVVSEKIINKNIPRSFKKNKYTVKDVACIIPAHNEESVILRTLTALSKVLPKKQIYVASDYSTDRTVAICKKFGVRCLDIRPNMGKARAITYIIKKKKLLKKYKFILINDADTELDKNYLNNALPIFNDRDIAAIAGHGVSRTNPYNFWQAFFIAYRIRVWSFMQLAVRYGQTWKYSNFSFIIPGAFSIYRTKALRHIEIDAPGLIIEDFNMTFEVHKKNLGKIAYNPKVFGTHQDPSSLRDYIKQMQRWDIGFFQTVKRHGVWPGMFWLMTTLYYIELYFFAIIIALTPAFLLIFIMNNFEAIEVPFVYAQLNLFEFLIGLVAIDYVITMIVTYIEKKPVLLLYGLGFFFLRYIDALIYLGSPIEAWFRKSNGTWKSPKRQ